MDPTTAALSVAAVSGLAAYVNGKYHIAQDLRVLNIKRRALKHYADLAKNKRLSVWYSFSQFVPEFSNGECIWSREKSYTWQQTHDKAVQWAQFFLDNGVKPGDLVSTYLINSADFLTIWLGLWCIGCAPAHINYNLKGESLVHCLKVAGAKIVLVDSEPDCAERFSACIEQVEQELGMKPFTVDAALLDQVYSGPINVPGDEYRENVTGPDPVSLFYTSGTTGFPKAGSFMVSRFHERGNPKKLNFNQKAGPGGDRWYCCMPLFHGTGGVAIMTALAGGLSVAVGRKFSVSTFWDDICDSNATFFIYVGEAARYLLMAPPHPRERDHRLRAMYGNGMRPDVWVRFQERFNVSEVIEFFNSTEGVLALAVYSKGPFTAATVGQHGVLIRRALNDVFVPVSTDLETGDIIRDPKTGFATRNSYNEGGEILVKVPTEKAFAGYHNNPKATAKKFERNVFKPGDLYYRSGDALRRDDDGRWFFLDRLGDTFRWKSENVSTAEVAETLGKYPGVGEAIVYGALVPKHDGRAGCAAIRLEDNIRPESFDWKAFLEYSRNKLPRYAVPVFVRLLKQGSTTDNQKQNKVPLREEGIYLDKYGTKVTGGADDAVMWTKPGADSYVRFTPDDLSLLQGGKTML